MIQSDAVHVEWFAGLEKLSVLGVADYAGDVAVRY